jgi:hypothetical protein
MAKRQRLDKGKKRTMILTLRLTNEEMLRLKVAALSIGKQRAKIVRARLTDLICAPAQAAVVEVNPVIKPEDKQEILG